MKRYGFSDKRLGELTGAASARSARCASSTTSLPVYKAVDTCAAEFEAETPYFYSTYEEENEAEPGDKERVVILGSGPNRIGQGIEFDYCCVHAALTAREQGYEAVMVNCNPETVSTDYDISDRLYFEPLTFEDVANIVANERPKGVIVQFGGQTPLKIAARSSPRPASPSWARRRSPSTSPRTAGASARCSRSSASAAPSTAWRRRPRRPRRWPHASATRSSCGRPTCSAAGPCRSSTARQELEHYMTTAVSVSPEHPVLIDKFLEDAIEVDVDAVCDGEDVYIGAVMQHVEEAGVHSGDSACVIPSISLGEGTLEQVRKQTRALALGARRARASSTCSSPTRATSSTCSR